MKVAILGDSFVDEYLFGDVNRISPEAPVPILDVRKREQRGGGAINVANNLYGLGIDLTLFTITSMKLPYKVISPQGCSILKKTRYIGNGSQLLRVDEPPHYLKQDLKKMIYPNPDDFDLIAFVDYDKGIVTGGEGTIVDSKKKDLSVFKGTEYLKINNKEYAEAENKGFFRKAFITKNAKGIDYYEYGEYKFNEPIQAKEVIDITGAGDTVTATLIFCIARGITEPKEMMRLANKAAGIVVGKLGTSIITLKELNG